MSRTPLPFTSLVCSVIVSCTTHVCAVQAPPLVPTKTAARPAAPPALQQERTAERQFSARLLALSPDQPEGYFLLAEEVADGAESDPARRRLATRLYVLAYDLARQKPEGRETAASSCLGLASVAGTARDKQFLRSLARTLDPRQTPPGWVEVPEIATSDSGAYRLAVLLGDIRAGEGLRARRLLEDPDVSSLLERYDTLLAKSGWDLGTFTVRREAGRWPCSECRNERVVRRAIQGVVEYQICPVCSGHLGPRLTSSQLLAQLRFEAWLLQGSQRSWASQIGMDGGLPLVEPDPNRVGVQFGVDPTLTLWRNGSWVADPKAPKPEPKNDEAKDAPPPQEPEPSPPPAGP